MITSHDILEKTGLKSTKTLTRWHQRGLIPEPLVRTHPSGRGKVAYWPDWVLDRCLRIVELQREGHSLESAALMLGVERLRRNLERVEREPKVSDLLAAHQVKLTPEREGSLLDALLLGILASVKHRITNDQERRVLLAKLRDQDVVGWTLNLWRAGYNPVLVYDGEQVEVVPDFLVGQRLSQDHPPQTTFVVAPLRATLLQGMPWLEQFVGTPSMAWPAPKIWQEEGEALVEYTYSPTGPVGFEVIHETAKVISVVQSEEGTDA